MAKHRDQAQFDRAAWRLSILVPCWISQLSLMLVLVGVSAYLFANGINEAVEVRDTALA